MAKSQIVMKASPEAVFVYLADFRRHGEWATHPGLMIEPEDEGPLQAGSRFFSHGRQFGRALDDALTVTAYAPPSLLAFESRGKSGAWRHSFELAPAGETSTRVTKHMDTVQPSLLLRLLTPLIAVGLARRLHKDLAGIRTQVEGSTHC